MPLDAAALVLLLAWPFCHLVARELRRLDDPAYLREHGVVIVSERALEAHSDPIGDYQDHPIWETVTFMGMLYCFDRIVDPRERESLAARELFLFPGLVYVTH